MDRRQREHNDNQKMDVTQSDNKQQSPESQNQQRDFTVASRNQQSDFALPPGVPWHIIISNLNMRDILALAVTCWHLYDSCKKAKLCLSAKLYLGNWGSRWSSRRVELNSMEKSLLESYSHNIQILEFRIDVLLGLRFSRRSFYKLNEATVNWPLKELRIVFRNCEFAADPANNNMTLNIVCHLLRNCLTSDKANKLEKLVVSKCTWTNDEGSVILEALKVSSFTRSLKYLSLGRVRTIWPHCSNHTIPHVIQCLRRFQNLHELNIWVGFLSDELLETLSQSLTSQFKTLKFYGACQSLHVIGKWPQLINAFPELGVNLSVRRRVNCEKVPGAFPNIVPLKTVEVREFTENDIEDIIKLFELLPNYSHTLTTFHWNSDTMLFIDDELIDMVYRCANMKNLVYRGWIQQASIVTLVMNRIWQSLRFLQRRIMFPEHETETLEVQMSKLKTVVNIYQPDKCKLTPTDTTIVADKYSQWTRPTCFEVMPNPVQL